jgi:sugar/nucleoside kinase (ribokinase family)
MHSGSRVILPLDHTFLLGSERGKSAALRELRVIDGSIAAQPRVAFPFESYQRSAGGRIANILACLGASGAQVAVCGAVGDDEPGRIVRDELARDRVDSRHIRVCARRHTRVVLLVGASGAPSAQVHVKQKPVARFSSSMLAGLPASEVLIVGRASRGAIQHVINHRGKSVQTVAAHIASWPWRQAEIELHKELLGNVDILILDSTIVHSVNRSFQLSAHSPLGELAKKTSATLVVAYGGLNKVEAILTGAPNAIRPDDCQGIEVTDPTGMMESFHGGVLSFMLRHRNTLEHAHLRGRHSGMQTRSPV